MDYQNAFNWLGGIATTALGWLLNTVWNAHKDLKSSHEAHKLEVAKDYITRANLRETFNELKETLRRIENKLDNKVDK